MSPFSLSPDPHYSACNSCEYQVRATVVEDLERRGVDEVPSAPGSGTVGSSGSLWSIPSNPGTREPFIRIILLRREESLRYSAGGSSSRNRYSFTLPDTGRRQVRPPDRFIHVVAWKIYEAVQLAHFGIAALLDIGAKSVKDLVGLPSGRGG